MGKPARTTTSAVLAFAPPEPTVDASAGNYRALVTAATSIRSTYGVVVAIAANDPSAVEHAWERLPADGVHRSTPVNLAFEVVHGAGEFPYSVMRNGEPLIEHAPLDVVVEAVVESVLVYASEHSTTFAVLHAGAVVWNGKAIILPARPYSGKTTLVTALMRLGAEVVSDEYAFIDAGGSVHPVDRPLSLRKGEEWGHPRAIEELGGRRSTAPAPVGLVVLTRYETGARWSPVQLTPGHAVVRLIDNAFAAQTNSALVLRSMSALARTVMTIESARGEANDIAPLLLQLLEGSNG